MSTDTLTLRDLDRKVPFDRAKSYRVSGDTICDTLGLLAVLERERRVIAERQIQRVRVEDDGEEREALAKAFDALKEDIAKLVRQRNYLARTARIPARVTHCDYDPAGDTTEYEADKEAIELFGDDALYFVIGCGPTPTHFSLITGRLKP